MHDDERSHHQGLQQDLRVLRTMADRRQLLRWMAGASLIPLIGCGGEEGDQTLPPGESTSDATACTRIPEETAGPYPGDGSNGANALVLSGIVRSDIRASLAGATGVAQGVPLTINLTLVNSSNGCAPLEGYAIYLWHCDRAGLYSMYSAGVTNENYLRGVQVTDSAGKVSFTSIFPGCYAGRWPHIHFEMYPSVSAATNSRNKVATSQLALPKATCDEAYTATGYSQSVTNLRNISLATDNVFRDGYASQLATVTGSVGAGYVSELVVGIAR
ncbi:intradiol ring-cleavage dioxygenase [Myxococcus sp. K15C18031901]|uniref:intradiol ring-cleavage dioxygenase n=1 Tax=Myxococcus dinghuensis TaxID=2906761 RepID=UPI0020A77CF4|nr:intradiol ring-cleavage dioxygenase [Myxococcus dinghuensis]MCP3098039.1 intradiol ring-cleavage dioxygenase [Myxococcus dinghuensis]